MRIAFRNKKLERLYYNETNLGGKYSPEVIDSFFDVMSIIEAIPNEGELYTFKGLRFEKLKGQRGNKGQHSIRLNNQFRLIIIFFKGFRR